MVAEAERPVSEGVSKPGECQSHPELVTQCREDGKGWRRDEYGNWWPCGRPAESKS